MGCIPFGEDAVEQPKRRKRIAWTVTLGLGAVGLAAWGLGWMAPLGGDAQDDADQVSVAPQDRQGQDPGPPPDDAGPPPGDGRDGGGPPPM